MDNYQNVVDSSVRSLRLLKKQRDALDAQIKDLEDTVKKIMEETKTYEFVGDDWQVTWNMITSSRFDQKTFRESHPGMYEQYKQISESRRFLLT